MVNKSHIELYMVFQALDSAYDFPTSPKFRLDSFPAFFTIAMPDLSNLSDFIRIVSGHTVVSYEANGFVHFRVYEKV